MWKKAWWVFLMLMPIVGLIVGLVSKLAAGALDGECYAKCVTEQTAQLARARADRPDPALQRQVAAKCDHLKDPSSAHAAYFACAGSLIGDTIDPEATMSRCREQCTHGGCSLTPTLPRTSRSEDRQRITGAGQPSSTSDR